MLKDVWLVFSESSSQEYQPLAQQHQCTKNIKPNCAQHLFGSSLSPPNFRSRIAGLNASMEPNLRVIRVARMKITTYRGNLSSWRCRSRIFDTSQIQHNPKVWPDGKVISCFPWVRCRTKVQIPPYTHFRGWRLKVNS